MGILKVGRQVSLNNSHFEHSFYAANVDDIGRQDRSISGEVSGDDFSDCELAEVGCELSMFQGQLFNIPYELYDLPDLTGILSLETWNSCLTEEERFMLSAFLPDMDQQTFWSTMKELLGGNEMFFDSPLAVFFRNLKGGYYHEKVTCYKDNLQFLQGIACCHSLRLYHDNMIRTFLEMKRLWDPCTTSISVKERMHIWKAWKNHNKGVNTLDLNAFPEDEMASAEVDILPLPKKINSIYSSSINPVTSPLPMPIEIKFSPLNTSAKGVLKIKPTGLKAFQACIPKPAAIDSWALCQPSAKGVLKMVPKGPASQQEQPRALPVQTTGPALIEIPVSKTSRFSPLPSHVHRQDTRDYESLLRCHEVGIETHRSPYTPDCIMNQRKKEGVYDGMSLGSSARNVEATQTTSALVTGSPGHYLFVDNSESCPEKIDSSKNPPKVMRYTSESENCSKNLVYEARKLSLGSFQENAFTAEHCKGELKMACPNGKQATGFTDISGGVFRKSESNIGDHVAGEAQKLHEQPAPSIGLQDGLMLPKTYKRRKVQTNRLFDCVKPLAGDTNFSYGQSQEGDHLSENVNTLKIKFNNWKNGSQKKEGCLDG